MMKKTYYLLLLMLVSAAAKAQTNWVTKKLDEKIAIKFPAEPEKTTKNGIDIYTLRATDSIGYSANMMDYNIVVHLDSAALAPIKNTQEFANQMKMGIASSKQNYTFGDVVIGKWNTYTTYDIPAVDKVNKNTLLIHMVLIGSKMYSLSCRIPANTTTKNNELFFGSVELLKK